MRRATQAIVVLLCAACLLPLRSGATQQPGNVINGIGLIDYTQPPRFKVGDWVKYRVTGSSEAGMLDDYAVTVLISGEEKFWGEDCFWVETTSEAPEQPPIIMATLMSYSVFGDSLWLRRLMMYARKLVTEIDENQQPVQTLMKRPSTATQRDAKPRNITVVTDTVGTDTVRVPRGDFTCIKVQMRQGVGSSTDLGDSTIRTETRENRTIFYSDAVPITHVAREDIESLVQRRAWRIGHSQDAPLNTLDRGFGTARLLDFGSGGLTPTLTPKSAQKPLVRAAPAPAGRRRTPAR